MNAQTVKADIIQWITGLDDQSILLELKKLKEQSIKKTDWWDTLSIEERQSIERGLEDSKNGRTVPDSEVRKKYKKSQIHKNIESFTS